MGVHWTGIVFGLGGVIAFGYWTTDFLVVQRAMAAKDLRSAKMAPIIASYFKMIVPLIVILPGLLALAAASLQSGARERRRAWSAQLQRSSAADAGAVLWAWTARTWRHGSHRGFHVRNGGQRKRLCHGLDLRHLSPLHQQARNGQTLRAEWAAGARSWASSQASALRTW